MVESTTFTGMRCAIIVTNLMPSATAPFKSGLVNIIEPGSGRYSMTSGENFARVRQLSLSGKQGDDGMQDHYFDLTYI